MLLIIINSTKFQIQTHTYDNVIDDVVIDKHITIYTTQ